MPTYSVYAPFNGSVTSLNCYCNVIGSPCSDPCATSGTKCKDIANCKTCSSPCGCSGCCYHTIVGPGYCCPLDIAAAQNTYIYAYMSTNIYSVKFVHMSDVCSTSCTPCQNDTIDLGTYLELYTGLNATGFRVGYILYAHLKNRQKSNGQVVDCPNPGGSGHWGTLIGQIPPKPAYQQGCYSGPHTHFSVKTSSYSVSRNSNLGCASGVTASSTLIYSWS